MGTSDSGAMKYPAWQGRTVAWLGLRVHLQHKLLSESKTIDIEMTQQRTQELALIKLVQFHRCVQHACELRFRTSTDCKLHPLLLEPLGFLINYTIRVNTLASAKRSVRRKTFPMHLCAHFWQDKNGHTQATRAAAAEKQQKKPCRTAWNYT
jgi:hypothetical protein